ncbi:hypothetical protein GA0070616_3982 [Micromonospora nigra]|uniref:Release factor glutamine methyltransferase n=1 Tax=Micromonospora nigra TaxID=145857 RepID=A0A1C6SKJ3_9ACTN|nr:hypothetical protein [Micromonospora nigra]SCL29947.1 hypothetical protein GA0070616_3982 [Micromonospora nigra]
MSDRLAPGGHLVVESGREQAGALCAALSAAGLVPQMRRDADLDATVVLARN